jgi:hypothetical protein
LDKKWRDIFKSLNTKVNPRRQLNWFPSRQRELAEAEKQKKWNKVIRILADCPYLVLAQECATMRARACRGLGNIEAAVLFEKDAERIEKTFTKTESPKTVVGMRPAENVIVMPNIRWGDPQGDAGPN